MSKWFGVREATRMRNLYVQVLESHRAILNIQVLARDDTSEMEANIKLYKQLLEDAERRLKAIEEEENDQS